MRPIFKPLLQAAAAVVVLLTPEDLALWDREMHFVVAPGNFKVMIGSSSEDIRLTGEFSILADVKYKELH